MSRRLTYNWDDINVGSDSINSSDFFRITHLEHEKFETKVEDIFSTPGNQRIIRSPIVPDVVEISDKENHVKNHQRLIRSPSILNLNEDTDSESSSSPSPTTTTKQQPFTPQPSTSMDALVVPKPKIAQKSPKKCLPNICTNDVQTLVQPPRSTSSDRKSGIPNVFKYAEIYENKKKSQIKKMLNDDRKNRRFKSHPAPSFTKIHDFNNRKRSEVIKRSPIKIPNTPLVLQKAMKLKEKRAKQIQDYVAKLNVDRNSFKSKVPKVLTTQPFKPVLPERQSVEVVPFNFRVNERVEQRKKFDENHKRVMAELKLKEMQRKQEEEDKLVKLLRKQLEFKATPNPFAK